MSPIINRLFHSRALGFLFPNEEQVKNDLIMQQMQFMSY